MQLLLLLFAKLHETFKIILQFIYSDALKDCHYGLNWRFGWETIIFKI